MAAVHRQKHAFLPLVAFLSCFVSSSFAYQFLVGGRDGWVVNPSENYNHWAERNRFQVNDTLLFKYKSGTNSVLVVNKDDYDKCNTGNPLQKLDGGDSAFKFDRSGPFYFISGDKASCDQGQKLIVVVMAIRSPPLPPRVAPPTASAPSGSSPSPSPSPAGGAVTPAPGGSPLSPSPSPSTGAPGPSTSPLSPSPAGGAPTPGTQASGPSPATTSPGPSSSTTPGSPGSSTPGSPSSSTPGSGTPADVNASPPRPRSVAAPSGTPSIALIATVSLMLSVVLGGFRV